MSNEHPPEDTSAFWDAAATTFDDEPDHGLKAPHILAAWRELVSLWLPQEPVSILDIGCGTGSLSLLMAQLGHQVTGVDFSPEMIKQAEQKAALADLEVVFHVMDARHLQLASNQYDAIICRHLLWLMPDITAILDAWRKLLRPNGQIMLVEGYWSGGGLHAEAVVTAMPSQFISVTVKDLTHDESYWGKVVSDERYAVTARLSI